MPDIDFEKCQITHYPAEVLAKQAEPIENIDDNIRQLALKMADIMLEHKGIGLAGPQAAVGLRIFIISLDGTREGVKVYINPEVTPVGGLCSAEEGTWRVKSLLRKRTVYMPAVCSTKMTILTG